MGYLNFSGHRWPGLPSWTSRSGRSLPLWEQRCWEEFQVLCLPSQQPAHCGSREPTWTGRGRASGPQVMESGSRRAGGEAEARGESAWSRELAALPASTPEQGLRAETSAGGWAGGRKSRHGGRGGPRPRGPGCAEEVSFPSRVRRSWGQWSGGWVCRAQRWLPRGDGLEGVVGSRASPENSCPPGTLFGNRVF